VTSIPTISSRPSNPLSVIPHFPPPHIRLLLTTVCRFINYIYLLNQVSTIGTARMRRGEGSVHPSRVRPSAQCAVRPSVCPSMGPRQQTRSCYDTIRYDTRCYFNVRSKADMSQLNLPHGNRQLKKCKNRRTEK